MSNALQIIYRAAQKANQKLAETSGSNNRANAMGEALEKYVKDLICGVDSSMDKEEKEKLYDQFLSYKGNKNRSPDCMIRGGDAIEIKKEESCKGTIALNSSYPRAKLLKTDSRIHEECKGCEKWDKKDMLYVIGWVKKKNLRMLYMVYGDCFAADPEIYENLSSSIKEYLAKAPVNIETESTNELGRVQKFDPLQITSLRIRGMWQIEHPAKVFDDVYTVDEDKQFQIVCIMRATKYKSFPAKDRQVLENKKEFSVKNKKIKRPSDPEKQITVTCISLAQ